MRKGFTLIELLIVIVPLTVIIGFAGWSLVVGLRSWSSGQNRAEIRLDGNFALEKMVRDLSQANSITIADTDRVKFSADLDQDGEIESITFNTNANNLNRVVEDIIVALAKNVDTLQLTYYDLNNNLLEAPVGPGERDSIRVITISLTMDKGDESVDLSSSVYLRNQGT